VLKIPKVKPKQNLCILQGKSEAITLVALEIDPKSKGFNHLIMRSSK
jgi:hypothetical protein